MSLQNLPIGAGQGGANQVEIAAAVKELQGLGCAVGAGATAGTKVAVAAMRAEDTIMSVIRWVSGAPTDVTSHYSIADIHASGTITVSGAVANDACVVNGVTYTAQAAAGPSGTFAIGGTDTITATNLAAAINAHEAGWTGSGFRTPTVVASASGAVVTVKAKLEGSAGNSIVLTGATHLTASGSGTLANGSDTGGVVSDADHSATSALTILWFNKHP
jgi:hypothetical protein